MCNKEQLTFGVSAWDMLTYSSGTFYDFQSLVPLAGRVAKELNDGDYVNSFFHRLVDDFILQGGGSTFDGTIGSVESFGEALSVERLAVRLHLRRAHGPRRARRARTPRWS